MRVFTSVVFLILFSMPAAAQPVASRLTLQDAVAQALERHPDIVAARMRHEAARHRPAQVRSLPDPMISAGWTSAGNPLPGAGLGSEPTAGIGVMVSQDLPFPGKRDARAAVSAREADAEFEQIAIARLNVTARVKQAYYALASARAAGAVVDRNYQLLATLLKVSEERYAVGKAAQQDVIKAQTQLSVLELQQQRLRQAARAREGELNALMDRPAGTPLGQTDELTFATFTEDLATLIARANAGAPMLKRERVMADRSRLSVDLARLDYRPDFKVSGGYAFAGEMPAMYEFRLDLTIPLQRRRRAAAVAEQQHLASAAQRDLEGARLDLQGRIEADFEMAGTASRLALLYRDTVLPQARLALESSLASYQTGGVDFLSVLTNFSMVLEYEMTYVEQLADVHLAISRLEEMTGATIPH